ncbi:MAG: RdgB/HAM1 family non-canonical purine NTP pyrophosphatase [Rhodothermales bacterium]
MQLENGARFKLVIATKNEGKKKEIEALLRDMPIDIFALTDFPEVPDVVEDADTLEGNAKKKALASYAHFDMPALADDTGLEVAALNGRPGVYSARYAGEDGNAEANRALLCKELKGERNRSARFKTVMAFMDGSAVHYFDGVCDGRILDHEVGTDGFGYDPLFIPDGYEQTFAEMSPSTKNGISHRGRALRKFVAFLQESGLKTDS